MSQKSRKQLTVRFLYRLELFLTVFSISLAVFFYFGNTQEFLDITQLVILRIISFSTLVALMVNIFLLVQEVTLAIVNKTRHLYYIIQTLVCFFCLIIDFALAFISRLLIMLSAGM
ncbi:hypothetical protein K7I13_01125 [Brucepastera parasyntrophica]|uniref:hypothetical protein n=1 Tax=Brucepastera parasyntrophica TaxID=2880008 RepID=UPI00210CB65A|nr:hypothetical protein [Brucepastera parasyntrophica]ULQ59974.1 hypothetical protein K7I13_01125 [Brucepastera parasyntrophica]